ncbi:capsule assembly Wzi family protein [Fibrella sp. WM1]|uniref:capsule assembly Wzi family protein n=1 Tax=Fibrella musci TaxID=3242485 RepID=UPI0035226C41
MKHCCSCLFLLSILFSTGRLSAQSTALRLPSRYQVEVGAYLSGTGENPFWLRANQYGSVPYNTPAGTARIGFATEYDTSRRGLDIGYGVDVVANAAGATNLPPNQPLILQQAYVKARLGIFEAYVGRRREVFGLVDTLLTSGSYTWSGNALPVPKIQIGIPNYTPIGFTKGWLSVMGTFAHGWLGGRYVRHTFLHQKSLFFRIGKPQSTFRAYGGLNHAVVWGGVSPDLVGTGLVTSERLPASFTDYMLVVTGLRTGDQSLIPFGNNLTDFDLTNRIGNHLGSVDLAFEVDLRRHSLYLYRQNPFDSGALFYLTSVADGLNGIRLRSHNSKAIFQTLLFEFLNTTNQGGPEFVIEDPQRRGKVNYFNNAQFRDGWSYQRLGLGTPFITPRYNPDGTSTYGVFTDNNRIFAWHLAASGTLPITAKWLMRSPSYQAKLTLSRNLGTYDTPYTLPLTQFSAFGQVGFPIQFRSNARTFNGTEFIGRIAFDVGSIYSKNLGVYLGVRKTWGQ